MSTSGPSKKHPYVSLAFSGGALAAVTLMFRSSHTKQAPPQPTTPQDDLNQEFLAQYTPEQLDWCREMQLPDTLCCLYLDRRKATQQKIEEQTETGERRKLPARP